MTKHDDGERFASIERLYGSEAYQHLRELHFAVVGLGGVGSWAVEALARSGIGKLTLIDFDEVAPSNVNRQLHALTSTVGRKKLDVMIERVREIHPACEVTGIDDFITADNLFDLLPAERNFDYVIDAIDSIKFKAALIYYCKRNKIPIITTGGAGGSNDPGHIKIADLSRTHNDALAAKVRQRLRSDYGFSKNPKRTFGIECVYSTQHKVYPKEDGTVCHRKPGVHGVHLDCRFGYGSASFVTATFGFMAVGHAVNKALRRKMRK